MNNPVEGQKLSIDAVRFASQSIEVEPCLPPRIEIGNMMTMYGLVKIDLLQALRGAPQKQPSSPGACFVSVPTVIPVDTAGDAGDPRRQKPVFGQDKVRLRNSLVGDFLTAQGR